jgi:hypothetical protein
MSLWNVSWLSAYYMALYLIKLSSVFTLNIHCFENLDPTLKIILQIPINEREFGYF